MQPHVTHHDESGYPMHASTHSTNGLQPLDGAPEQADIKTLLRWYGLMHLGRILDEQSTLEESADPNASSIRNMPRVSSAGCESIQLALGSHFRGGSDMLLPGRGDLVTALSAGLTPDSILLTVFGKATAPAGGGRGTRDLFSSPNDGLHQVTGSDGNRARQAVGSARAFRSFDDDGIVLCSFAAHTAIQAALFESLSDAAREHLPVLFVLEDAEGITSHRTDNDGDIVAVFRGIAGLRIFGCDGTNIFDAWQAMDDAADHVRSGAGPVLLHTRCARINTSNGQRYDPLPRFRHWLLGSAATDETELGAIEKKNHEALETATARAGKAPDPDTSNVHRNVFADDTHVCPLSNEDFSRVVAKHAGELETVTLREAVARSLTDEFRRNPSTFLLSRHSDIHEDGGHHGLFSAMQKEFGDNRIMRLPFSATHLIGSATGFCRYRDDIWTVVESTMPDHDVLAALQEIVAAAEATWRSNGRFTPNILLRLVACSNGKYSTETFRNLEGMLAGIPGLRIVTPAFADDAAGLLRCAFRTRGITIFLEPLSLHDHDEARSLFPTPDLCVPIGRARLRREGGDLSIIAYGSAIHLSLKATEALSAHGINAEVLDLRSILPFDTEAIGASVRRTGRALVVHEAQRTGGFGGEIAAWIAEHCFDDLDAPVRRLAAQDIPIGPSGPLTDAVLPGASDIEAAARALANY